VSAAWVASYAGLIDFAHQALVLAPDGGRGIDCGQRNFDFSGVNVFNPVLNDSFPTMMHHSAKRVDNHPSGIES
jgi:hypothetical protein